MNRYLRLFRFGNGLIGIAGIFAGAIIARGFDILEYMPQIIISSIVVMIFIAGGNALNDYMDHEIDILAHPKRPIPMGEIKPNTAKKLGIGSIMISVVLSILFWDITATLMVILCAIFMTLYETTLKQMGLIGNLTIAGLTAMIFVVGGTIVDNPHGDYIFAFMAFLVNIGREISKDIEDMKSDRGRHTLPMSIGIKKSSQVASSMFIIGSALSVFSFPLMAMNAMYMLILIPDAMFLYCSYIVFTDAHKAQEYAKTAMVVALVSFILGVI